VYTGALIRVIVIEVPVKIIPELSAAKHLLVWFASRNGFIAEFLLKPLKIQTRFAL